MFFDVFEHICRENGVAPTRVLADLGISKSSYGHWKNGGDASNRTKRDIADYFGITVAELMQGKIKKAPAQMSEDDELNSILEEARRNPDLKILFSLSSKATPEEVKKYIKMIKLMTEGDDGGSDY